MVEGVEFRVERWGEMRVYILGFLPLECTAVAVLGKIGKKA